MKGLFMRYLFSAEGYNYYKDDGKFYKVDQDETIEIEKKEDDENLINYYK